MINQSISADWCTTKPIEQFSFTPRLQQVHSKAKVIHLTPGLPGFVVLFKSAKHMINQRISADWCTTKAIEQFSFTPHVQKVHSKAEVIHLTPGLPGFVVLFNRQAQEIYCETLLIRIYLQFGVQPSRLNHSLVHHMKHKYISKLRSYTLLLVSPALWYYSIVTHKKCIAKHMVNQRISADWCTTKPIAPFSCTPRVQQIHSKAEVITLLQVSQAYWYYSKSSIGNVLRHMNNHSNSAEW